LPRTFPLLGLAALPLPQLLHRTHSRGDRGEGVQPVLTPQGSGDLHQRADAPTFTTLDPANGRPVDVGTTRNLCLSEILSKSQTPDVPSETLLPFPNS
jgi:hypothetical protein